jgi:hypothetical protein
VLIAPRSRIVLYIRSCVSLLKESKRNGHQIVSSFFDLMLHQNLAWAAIPLRPKIVFIVQIADPRKEPYLLGLGVVGNVHSLNVPHCC